MVTKSSGNQVPLWAQASVLSEESDVPLGCDMPPSASGRSPTPPRARIRPRRTPKVWQAPAAQLQHVLNLYLERYRGLSATGFRRVLAADHAIHIADHQLRAALREAGLFLPVGMMPRLGAGRGKPHRLSVQQSSRRGPVRDARTTARVLVALDGSRRATNVFDAAAAFAERFGAALYPFRAIVEPAEFTALPQTANELARLGARAPRLTIEVPLVRIGQPWRLILEVADELDVDVIVLGRHCYETLDGRPSTTAARVTDFACRHVLVVDERGERVLAPLTPPTSPCW